MGSCGARAGLWGLEDEQHLGRGLGVGKGKVALWQGPQGALGTLSHHLVAHGRYGVPWSLGQDLRLAAEQEWRCLACRSWEVRHQVTEEDT